MKKGSMWSSESQAKISGKLGGLSSTLQEGGGGGIWLFSTRKDAKISQGMRRVNQDEENNAKCRKNTQGYELETPQRPKAGLAQFLDICGNTGSLNNQKTSNCTSSSQFYLHNSSPKQQNYFLQGIQKKKKKNIQWYPPTQQSFTDMKKNKKLIHQYSHHISVQGGILPSNQAVYHRSMDDLLHRNHVSLNLSETMAKFHSVNPTKKQNDLVERENCSSDHRQPTFTRMESSQKYDSSEMSSSRFNTFTDSNRKKDFFRLTDSHQLPHSVELSLCNRNFIDSINSLKKTKKSMEITQLNSKKCSSHSTFSKLPQNFNYSTKSLLTDKLLTSSNENSPSKLKQSSHTFGWEKDHVLQEKNAPTSCFPIQNMQMHSPVTEFNHLQPYMNEENSTIYQQIDGNNLINSPRPIVPNVIDDKKDNQGTTSPFIVVDRYNSPITEKSRIGDYFQHVSHKNQFRNHILKWQGSGNFKQSIPQKNFTLKHLSKVNDKGEYYNPKGQSDNCFYFSENTVKLSDCLAINSVTLFTDLPPSRENSKMEGNPSFYKKLKKSNYENSSSVMQSTETYESENNLKHIHSEPQSMRYNKMRKNSPIRKDDMIYNIRHLAILKYRREKKLLLGSEDPNDLIDYIKKKNQIQILLDNAKKIQSLEQVATLIENQITNQNGRINQIVDTLLVKFGMNDKQ